MSLSVSSDSSHAASASNLNNPVNRPDADAQPGAAAAGNGGASGTSPAAGVPSPPDTVSISAAGRSANSWPSLSEGLQSVNATAAAPNNPAARTATGADGADGSDDGQAQRASDALSRQIEYQPQSAMLTQAHGVPATVMALLGN